MERLCFGVSQINFNQNCAEEHTENRPPNFSHISAISAAGKGFAHSWDMATASCENPELLLANTIETEAAAAAADVDDGLSATRGSTPTSDEWESANEDAADGATNIARFSQRRNMPARKSKEAGLNKVKRRSIQKPTKRSATKSVDFSNLRQADIKKIYMNKKLTNFRPSNLETIFEEGCEEETASAAASSSQVRWIGGRKLKRSISCCDGLNINKTLIKQRRAKVKKTFGKRYALKKISLEDFMTQLNKSLEADSADEQDNLLAPPKATTASNSCTDMDEDFVESSTAIAAAAASSKTELKNLEGEQGFL